MSNSPQDERASSDDKALAGLFARAEEEVIPTHPDYDPDEGLYRFLSQLGSGRELTVQEASVLAIAAHDGQLEMYGAPYHEHLRTVAGALVPYGSHLVMAGWLHDILDGTEWTARELRAAGIPARVVEIVELVTPGGDYLDSIRHITQDPEATLVKIADNADSIHPERLTGTPDAETRRRLAEFEEARRILWSAAPREDIITVVSPINLPLLERLTTE